MAILIILFTAGMNTPWSCMSIEEWVCLLPSRKILCIIAELSEVLKPKKKESGSVSEQTCRWAVVWPCPPFPGPMNGVGLR